MVNVMEKNRIDATQFLLGGEKVLLKAHAQKSKGIYVETAFCLLFWLLTVVGDCFMVGYASNIKVGGVDVSWFLPFFIVLVVLHLVPLGMWVVSLSAKSEANSEKWFVLTDKRIISVTGGKPARAEFVDLKDVTSVKTAKNNITVGLEGGRYYKISGIAETAAFSKALSGALDEIFGDVGERERFDELDEGGVTKSEVASEEKDEGEN